MLLVDDEARHAPHALRRAVGTGLGVVVAAADQLAAAAELAPADGLAAGVHEDPVRTAGLDERPLRVTVDSTDLGSGAKHASWCLRNLVKRHAPAEVPAVAAREQALKVRPGALRQLLGLIRGTSHRFRVSRVLIVPALDAARLPD
jgi:hypothetical protein